MSRSPSFLNRLLRWSGFALLAAMSLGGAILAYLYLWVLPHIADYRTTLEDLLSSAIGFQVKLKEVGGEWGGTRPWFTLKDVTLYDSENKPVLHLDRLDGRFGWRSVIVLEPRFHNLSVSGTTLTLRRSEDGKFHVGGITIDPQSPSHVFSDWLLKQGEVTLQGVTLAWVDDFRHAPPLVLSDLGIDLKSFGRHHQLSLHATPPQTLAGPFGMTAQLNGRTMSKRKEWSGTLTGTFRNLNIAALSSWVDLPTLQTGRGGAVLTVQMHEGRLDGVEANMNMVDVSAKLDAQKPTVHLRKLAGLIGWTSSQGYDIVKAGGLMLQPDTGQVIGPLNARFGWAATGYQLAVDGLDLSSLNPLLPLIPLQADLRDRWAALKPAGRLDHLQASWKKPARQGARAAFSIDGRFRQLGWAPLGKWPGARGLSGSVSGDQDKGEFNLGIKPGQVSTPALFRDGTMDWARLTAEGGWRWKDGGYELRLANAVLENADLYGTLAGTYRMSRSGPDYMDLSGRLERATGAAVYKYMPRVVNDDTYTWLRKAILAGEARQAGFVLRGEPRQFPFRNDAGGVFHIDALVNGVTLRYGEDWPKIDAIDGELRFRGAQVEILSDQARIFNARLHKVRVVIPDFDSKDDLLDVKGEAEGPIGEFVRFANSSPVADRIDKLTAEASGSGDINLALNLKVPLRHSQDTTVAGRLTFNSDVVYPAPDMPRLEQVKGRLDFTGNSVSASRITARILGGPAAISASSPDSHAHIVGQGVFAAAALEPWLGKPSSHLLSGQASWKGELVLGHGRASMRMESSLAGLESKLPAPLAKPAGQAALLRFEQQPLKDGSVWSSASYANVLSGVWVSRPGPKGLKLERGEIRFGGKAQLSQEAGVSLAGYVRNFDLGRWLDLMPEGGGTPSALLSGINMTISSLDFLGRRFGDINLNGRLKSGILKMDVSGQGVQGSLAYRKAAEASPVRVSAVFKQLVIPAPLPGAAASTGRRISPADFPSLDVSVENLRFKDRQLGRLEAQARGGKDGLVIDQLKLSNPDGTLNMTGVWKDTGMGETRVNMETEISDAGKLLARLGYPDTVKRGKGTISGGVSWQGSPADFALSTLDGTLNFKSQNGQFLKADPGVAKLLGIISLQSLPRRLSLDFRDVFSGGFAFDEISATLRIAAGNVYSDDFLMKGPAATVKMSGMARLADETVQLRVKVNPKLSESVAVAGALIGGPIAGLGALAVQKLLKNPLEEATSYEYLVSGPWAEPNVTRLSRTKPAKEQQAD